MNVTNKTIRTFDILGITERQAKDLLSISAKVETPPGMKGDYLPLEKNEVETLNILRQALLDAGITKGEPNAS